jgi:hypothetical protein
MKYAVVFGLFSLIVGCGEALAPTGGSGGGGTGADGGEGGTGGQGGAEPECQEAADCPDTPLLCHVPACQAGACGAEPEPNGTTCKSLSQDGEGTCVDGACMDDECVTADDCTGGTECMITYCTLGVCQYVEDTHALECDGESGQCVTGTCQPNPCMGATDGSPCALCDVDGKCMAGLCFNSGPNTPNCK